MFVRMREQVEFHADGFNHFVCKDYPAHAHWSMRGNTILINWGRFGQSLSLSTISVSVSVCFSFSVSVVIFPPPLPLLPAPLPLPHSLHFHSLPPSLLPRPLPLAHTHNSGINSRITAHTHASMQWGSGCSNGMPHPNPRIRKSAHSPPSVHSSFVHRYPPWRASHTPALLVPQTGVQAPGGRHWCPRQPPRGGPLQHPSIARAPA